MARKNMHAIGVCSGGAQRLLANRSFPQPATMSSAKALSHGQQHPIPPAEVAHPEEGALEAAAEGPEGEEPPAEEGDQAGQRM